MWGSFISNLFFNLPFDIKILIMKLQTQTFTNVSTYAFNYCKMQRHRKQKGHFFKAMYFESIFSTNIIENLKKMK